MPRGIPKNKAKRKPRSVIDPKLTTIESVTEVKSTTGHGVTPELTALLRTSVEGGVEDKSFALITYMNERYETYQEARHQLNKAYNADIIRMMQEYLILYPQPAKE